MDPSKIAEIIANLAATDEQQLRDAWAAVRAAGVELAAGPQTPESTKALRELAKQSKALREELAERDDRAAALAELDGTHDPARDAVEHPDGKEGVAAADGTTTARPTKGDKGADAGKHSKGDDTGNGTEGDGDTGDGETDGDKGGDTARTAAGGRKLGRLNRGDQRPEGAKVALVAATTHAATNLASFNAGAQLTSQQLAEAFRDKAQQLHGPSAVGRHDVARIQFAYPPERVLDPRDGYEVNQEKMANATDRQAVTAAGGLCLPLDVQYDIATVGVETRPIKSALVGFQVSRGGLQYRAPFDALSMSQGLGIWTQTQDQNANPADPATLKSCYVASCPGVLEASIYSTYMCLEFPNMTARFDTEWVDATTRSSMVAWARFAENQLLSRLLNASKLIKGTRVLGAVRDILANYDKLISYYRSRHRLDDAVPLRTIAPRWLIDMLRTDMARAMNTTGDPSGQFSIAQATLESFFRTRNVNVTWHLDGLAGATVNGVAIPDQFYGTLAAGNTVPKWPNYVDTMLYVEGDWLFLDGGTLDLGLVRDSNLNSRNRYQTFVENFEGVAFRGIESLRLVMPLQANGASSGTVAPGDFDNEGAV